MGADVGVVCVCRAESDGADYEFVGFFVYGGRGVVG